jgi:hypothetical protein
MQATINSLNSQHFSLSAYEKPDIFRHVPVIAGDVSARGQITLAAFDLDPGRGRIGKDVELFHTDPGQVHAPVGKT